jgi:NTE family protein
VSVKNNIKIGYALGGGGARGLSHIGVLKVLDENGIFPDIIAGTSIGAMVGALYAGGYKPGEIERLVLEMDWKKLVRLADMTFPLSGLLQGKRVVSLLRSILGDLTFPQLRYTFACVATDIINGEQVILRDGSLIEAIHASISIPGIFKPVAIMGRYLVDGSLINAVPVSVCREMGAGYVIGVNVIPEPGKVMCNTNKDQQLQVCESTKLEYTGDEAELVMISRKNIRSLRSRIADIENATKMFITSHLPKGRRGKVESHPLSRVNRVRRLRTKSPRLIEVLSQTLTIAEYQVAAGNLKDADLVINPNVEEIGFWQFNNAAQAISAGERAARIVLDRNKLANIFGKF